MFIKFKINSRTSRLKRQIQNVGKKTFIELYSDRYNPVKINQSLMKQTYSNKKVKNKHYTPKSIQRKKSAMHWLTENNCEKAVLLDIINSKLVPQNIKNKATKFYNNP